MNNIKEGNEAIIKHIYGGLRTNGVVTTSGKKYPIEEIIIYNEENQYNVGRYFYGTLSEVKNYKINYDIFNIQIEEIKNRRSVNLTRKENFICKNVLYLYNGLDVSIIEAKRELRFKNEYEEVYNTNVYLKFKNNFEYYVLQEKKEGNKLTMFLVGSMEHVPTKKGEEKRRFKEEFEKEGIKIDDYQLENLLSKYDLIKKQEK